MPTKALRFAHPYFVPTPADRRPRMLDHVEKTLHPIPPVKRGGLMMLADIIGKENSDAIAASYQITLHIGGDTGVRETDHETWQVIVADAMARDYDPNQPATRPAFFLHLGDVVYGPNPAAYLEEFYRPYMHYPGKIVAIPGNHDGESDKKMAEFQEYFCAASQTVPPIA